MHTATFRTIVHSADEAAVRDTAFRTADALTIVEAVSTTPLHEMTEVGVHYKALNANEANATARSIRTALGHLGATDEGRVMI